MPGTQAVRPPHKIADPMPSSWGWLSFKAAFRLGAYRLKVYATPATSCKTALAASVYHLPTYMSVCEERLSSARCRHASLLQMPRRAGLMRLTKHAWAGSACRRAESFPFKPRRAVKERSRRSGANVLRRRTKSGFQAATSTHMRAHAGTCVVMLNCGLKVKLADCIAEKRFALDKGALHFARVKFMLSSTKTSWSACIASMIVQTLVHRFSSS